MSQGKTPYITALHQHFQNIIALIREGTLVPYVRCDPELIPHLRLMNLPFGIQIRPEHRFSPTSSRKEDMRQYHTLLALDNGTFEDQAMGMAQWVFNTFEIMGCTIGLMARARDLPDPLRAQYANVLERLPHESEELRRRRFQIMGGDSPLDDDAMVALSMWMALETMARLEHQRRWVGHNLSSCRVFKDANGKPLWDLKGLGLFTKVLGLLVLACGTKLPGVTEHTQTGSTQADSGSLWLHLSLASDEYPMVLRTAQNLQHSHPSIEYSTIVDENILMARLMNYWTLPYHYPDLIVEADDLGALKRLQKEAQTRGTPVYRIVNVIPPTSSSPQQLHLTFL